MKSKLQIIAIFGSCIIASSILGFVIGPDLFGHSSTNINGNEYAATGSDTDSLAEALYGVQVIVKGTVNKVLPVEMRDAGIVGKGSFQYEVTPATISVTQVVYGEVPESKEITYLQHGVEDKKTSSVEFVHEGDQVLLMLTKTPDGKYWSYNFDDGIWKLNNGKMQSKTHDVQLKKLVNTNYETFSSSVRKEAKQQMKPKDIE
jgi:hypothetical protein